MRKNARKTVENAHAELDYVVAPRARAEIIDDVVPEVRCKYEGIMAPVANQQIVAGSACQRISAGRAHDRAARTRADLASTIELLSLIRMHCIRYGRRRREAQRPV